MVQMQWCGLVNCKRTNNEGPKADHWGTPHLIEAVSDRTPLHFMNWE